MIYTESGLEGEDLCVCPGEGAEILGGLQKEYLATESITQSVDMTPMRGQGGKKELEREGRTSHIP